MKTLPTLKLGSLAVCGLLLSGCYTTTLSSGKPAAPASLEYDEKWHHGVAWGMAELSGPYDLEKVCPSGWSEIKTETSFANGFVHAVTSGVYSPQTVTVRCAAGARPAADTMAKSSGEASAPSRAPTAAAIPSASAPSAAVGPAAGPLPPPPSAPSAP
jgi:hypothetical protein